AVRRTRRRGMGRSLCAVAALAALLLFAPKAHAAPTNLARGAVATVSSVENAGYPGSNAIDGDPTTRWSSAFSDPQWIELDLGAKANISEITLLWEASYGSAYKLEVADDNSTWTTVASTSTGDGGTDDYPNLTASGRYVRLTGTARALPYGYSLYEFQVFGD